MDLLQLRRCCDLVNHLRDYVSRHPEDQAVAVFLVQLDPATFFIIDGLGPELVAKRVSGEADEVVRFFHEKVDRWEEEFKQQAPRCVVGLSAATLLDLRDHPTTMKAVGAYLSGRVKASNGKLAARLAKMVKASLSWYRPLNEQSSRDAVDG